jgi:hypothetical protein
MGMMEVMVLGIRVEMVEVRVQTEMGKAPAAVKVWVLD